MKDYLRKHKQMVTINTWLANDPARVRSELTDMSNKMGKPAETSADGEWWGTKVCTQSMHLCAISHF